MVSHCLNSNKARRPFSSDISFYDFYRYYETCKKLNFDAMKIRCSHWMILFNFSENIAAFVLMIYALFYLHIQFFLIFSRYLFYFFPLSYNLLFILIRGQCLINSTDFCMIPLRHSIPTNINLYEQVLRRPFPI